MALLRKARIRSPSNPCASFTTASSSILYQKGENRQSSGKGFMPFCLKEAYLRCNDGGWEQRGKIRPIKAYGESIDKGNFPISVGGQDRCLFHGKRRMNE